MGNIMTAADIWKMQSHAQKDHRVTFRKGSSLEKIEESLSAHNVEVTEQKQEEEEKEMSRWIS